MRSLGATNVEAPCLVTSPTNLMIACFAGPSFQDASGCALDARANAQSRHRIESASQRLASIRPRRPIDVAFSADFSLTSSDAINSAFMLYCLRSLRLPSVG